MNKIEIIVYQYPPGEVKVWHTQLAAANVLHTLLSFIRQLEEYPYAFSYGYQLLPIEIGDRIKVFYDMSTGKILFLRRCGEARETIVKRDITSYEIEKIIERLMEVEL